MREIDIGKLVEHLLLQYCKDNIGGFTDPKIMSKYIGDEVKRIQSISDDIDYYNENINNIQKEMMSKIDAESVKIRNVKKTCKHELTKYYPDASGNNDSWTECSICGTTL